MKPLLLILATLAGCATASHVPVDSTGRPVAVAIADPTFTGAADELTTVTGDLKQIIQAKLGERFAIVRDTIRANYRVDVAFSFGAGPWFVLGLPAYYVTYTVFSRDGSAVYSMNDLAATPIAPAARPVAAKILAAGSAETLARRLAQRLSDQLVDVR